MRVIIIELNHFLKSTNFNNIQNFMSKKVVLVWYLFWVPDPDRQALDADPDPDPDPDRDKDADPTRSGSTTLIMLHSFTLIKKPRIESKPTNSQERGGAHKNPFYV
jgi:hypothetical protein